MTIKHKILDLLGAIKSEDKQRYKFVKIDNLLNCKIIIN